MSLRCGFFYSPLAAMGHEADPFLFLQLRARPISMMMVFTENKKLERILRAGEKVIPRPLFHLARPIYHWLLAWLGAIVYGFPSWSMKVVGVTGTKGKSTTVFLLAKIFEAAGKPVAMLGSLGYKIRAKEWPNTLKMTMPGRLKIQKFLAEAKRAGCQYVFLEVTSEGIKQKRHLGIRFDSAVLTNIHREHLESHGSFENYIRTKKKLFRATRHAHILNEDDPMIEQFKNFPADKKIFYGAGDWQRLGLRTKLKGVFNQYNVLAAAVTAESFGLSSEIIKQVLAGVDLIPGRMEEIKAGQPFKVVVDYAHTPDSLAMVYQTLKNELSKDRKLICVLGAAGGGRDKWKRPEFGRLAAHYGDEIILTNEDPYDENPEEIIEEISSGVPLSGSSKVLKILDRREAIKQALADARPGDTVAITGKGSETSIAVADGQKLPWSDAQTVRDLLSPKAGIV